MLWLHSCPEGSTVSRYATFQQVKKSTGKEPDGLKNRPPFSPVLQNAFDVFNALNQYTFQELDAYTRLTGNALEWWEVQAVMGLANYREVKPEWPPKQLR